MSPGEDAGDDAARLQALLERLEETRRRLEESEDSESAVDVLQDLVKLARDVQAEIDRQRGEAG